MTITTTDHLTSTQAEEVVGLAERARATDGVAPLSEQFVLDLRRPAAQAVHLLTPPGSGVRGYAQIATDGAVELVVDPAARRSGHGRSLVRAVLQARPDARFWAHGNLAGAQALAAVEGLRAVRDLRVMARPLTEADRAEPVLPAPLRSRPFVVGQDEAAWLEVNAAAFSHHPEQGRMTLADLEAREAQAWFDPDGLILVEDPTELVDGRPRVVAFHWTKVDPEATSSIDPTRPAGEVYVVGIHPDRQGRGLAGPLTALGTSHLARLGLPEVILYVDGDNTPAVATYHRAGFSDAAVHVMYAR